MVIGKALQKLLRRYQAEHEISENKMADLAGVSRTSMQRWCQGHNPKNMAAVRRACETLGVDAETLLSPGFRYIGIGFSFKILQAYFTERVAIEPQAVYELVILAGATLHTRLLKAGFPFTSTTLPTGQVVMHAAQDAQVGKLVVSLQWTNAAIMLVVASSGQPPLLSEPLNEDTFTRAVEILKQ